MMRCKTIVRNSQIHGKGLFALSEISAGEIVAPIVGEIVLRKSQSRFAIWLSGGRSLLLQNKTKWINHSSEPNVKISVKKESVIALTDIQAGEELTSAYESVF